MMEQHAEGLEGSPGESGSSGDAPWAVEVYGLSKKYRLGVINRHTLVEEAQYFWHKLRGRDPRQHMSTLSSHQDQAPAPQHGGGHQQDFWALRDVQFKIAPGEIVGVVGHNGSGKSTLLKLLTRITEPTEGRARIYGRVASLLEVGTGFHPDLSGRENVFLNGTLLGMTRREVSAKLDEIMAFAELDLFMDTPVKRYSSGMYVRLAFAVAAHLEPEILLVDEVLAVGDASFQSKCLGKMSEVASGGRTVFFVSHNMAAVESLCTRALLLQQGRLIMDDTPRNVLAHYLKREQTTSEKIALEDLVHSGSGILRFTRFHLENSQGQVLPYGASGDDVSLVFEVENHRASPLSDLRLDIGVDSDMGTRICWISSTMLANQPSSLPPGRSEWRINISRLPLAPGRYGFAIHCIAMGELADALKIPGAFEVVSRDVYGVGREYPANQGYFLLQYNMAVHPVIEEAAS